jgi:hypothetical protein
MSRVDTRPNSHKLTQLEEDSLVQWILSIDTRGAAPRRATVREIADILLAARRITPPPTVCHRKGGIIFNFFVFVLKAQSWGPRENLSFSYQFGSTSESLVNDVMQSFCKIKTQCQNNKGMSIQ